MHPLADNERKLIIGWAIDHLEKNPEDKDNCKSIIEYMATEE